MSAQFDLFASFPPPAAAPAKTDTPVAIAPKATTKVVEQPAPERITPVLKRTAPVFPPRAIAWERLLAQHGVEAVEWHLPALWTGQCVETLSAGPDGRWFLMIDGTIRNEMPDGGSPKRVIFVEAKTALALHREHGLVEIGPRGRSYARYRLAQPGDEVPALLPLPDDVLTQQAGVFLNDD